MFIKQTFTEREKNTWVSHNITTRSKKAFKNTCWLFISIIHFRGFQGFGTGWGLLYINGENRKTVVISLTPTYISAVENQFTISNIFHLFKRIKTDDYGYIRALTSSYCKEDLSYWWRIIRIVIVFIYPTLPAISVDCIECL